MKYIHSIKNKFKNSILPFINKNLSALPRPKTPKFVKKITDSKRYKDTFLFLNKYSPVLHIPYSMLICFIMEWLSRHSFFEGLGFVVHHPLPFLYNSYVIYIILSLVFLIKRRTFLRTIITALFIMLGTVNSVVLTNRVTPFGFTDLYMIGDLLTMQNTQYFTRQQAMLVVFVLIIFVLCMVLLFIFGKKESPRYKLPIRIAIVLLSLVSFLPTTKLLQGSNILASYFGNLAQGYLDYGFLYGLSTSIYGRGMEKPFNYSQATVDRVLEKVNMGKSKTDSKNGPNIIVILLESFYDISEANFIETDTDPIPFFHYLEDNFSSGYCTVPVVGAGTCNTEFEVLTGMSCQFFGPGEYPQKTILKETDCESFADNLNSLGYSSHVVHNNGGNFYSRANAFSMMGFDSFTCKEVLDITEWTPLRSWPKDNILTGATKDALDSTEGPDFVYTITVETHGDYPTEDILDNTYCEVTCEGKDIETTNRWKYYTQMLHNEDNFLRSYINALEKRDEDTLVVMFGDHLPTMGLSPEEISTGNLFKTKYITWNNFGMEKKDVDLTSYQLVPEFLNRLNIHGGTILDYNQYMTNNNVRAGSFSYMNNLQLLQYDLLYGNRYAYGQTDKYPATDLTMGNKDVVIDRIYPFGGKLHIYGQNFTPWSSVFVKGKKIATTYESGEHLSINLSSIKNGYPLFVGQVGSNNTIFRRSNLVHYINPGSLSSD